MNDFISAIILGIVQGLGEFLPISSSGHLVLARSFLELRDQGLSFDVALHFGTLIAVLYFYRDDLTRHLRGTLNELTGAMKSLRSSKRGFIMRSVIREKHMRFNVIMAAASVPGAMAGLLMDDLVENLFRNPIYIAVSLGVFGLLLLAADMHAKSKKDGEKITTSILNISFKRSLIIGIAQALAIIPGVSRSGITITAGLFSGFDRGQAAKFSFILSMPIILGASMSKLPDLVGSQNADGIGMAIVGMAAAFVSGFLSIKYMLQYLTGHSYTVFVMYRVALAAVILLGAL